MHKSVSTVTSPNASTCKSWKTVKLGTGIKDADGFRKAIRDSRMKIDTWASHILSKPQVTVAQEPSEVRLVVVTLAELGFEQAAELQDIYEAAKTRGLRPCPNEVGPQLRLQYPDQPLGEWLVIGIEPIVIVDGLWRLFLVGHGSNGRLLKTDGSRSDWPWEADRPFVFMLPSK